MNQKILGYKPPIWQELLFIGEGVVGAGFLAWGFLVIFKTLRKKDEDIEIKIGGKE